MKLSLLLLKIITFSGVLCSNTCPSDCKCGTYNYLNTVDCTFQWLINIESDLPTETQVLDLSHNNIMEMGDSAFCFTEPQILEVLNVSYNKIGQIHMNGLNCLNGLKILDLSHNIIQYILPHWFWDMLSLKELHLEHNDLYSFRPDGPFFQSDTLQLLDLSFCKLSYINKEAFKQIPNLKTLDVSGNFLYQLNNGVIEPLQKLEVLRATNNSWTCNGALKKLGRYCITHGIHCSGICETKTNGKKFEKIISKVVDTSVKNNTFNGFQKTLLPLSVQNCTVNVKSDNFWRTALHPFYVFTVLITFTVGITLGLIFGCWMSNSCKVRRYRRKYYKVKKRDRPLIKNCDSLGMSTPVLYRKFEIKT